MKKKKKVLVIENFAIHRFYIGRSIMAAVQGGNINNTDSYLERAFLEEPLDDEAAELGVDFSFATTQNGAKDLLKNNQYDLITLNGHVHDGTSAEVLRSMSKKQRKKTIIFSAEYTIFPEKDLNSVGGCIAKGDERGDAWELLSFWAKEILFAGIALFGFFWIAF